MDLIDIQNGIIVFVCRHDRDKTHNFFLVFDEKVLEIEEPHLSLFGPRFPAVFGFLVV